MLRVLLCMSCCSAPPSNRAAKKRRISVANDQKNATGEGLTSGENSKELAATVDNTDASDRNLVDENDIKKLITLGAEEKSRLLANQIQANNSQTKEGAALTASALTKGNLIAQIEYDSFNASTSAGDSSRDLTKVERPRLLNELSYASGPISGATQQQQQQLQLLQQQQQQLYRRQQQRESQQVAEALDLFDEQSLTPASGKQLFNIAPSSDSSSNSDSDEVERFRNAQLTSDGLGTAQSRGAEQMIAAEDSARLTSAPINIMSTTKIGDYARLEYSPVEDLESLAAKSRDQSLSRQNSTRATTNESSRRSSRGIESTSISIASQLSNEQLQQNLTNMLESANSPQPFFGTIGLPLGPPLESADSVTAKTSPETTGAALTSASQDSLSDTPLVDETVVSKQTKGGTIGSTSSAASTTGAALVASESMERSYAEDYADTSGQFSSAKAPLATGEAIDEAGPPSTKVTGNGNNGRASITSAPSIISTSSAATTTATLGPSGRVDSPMSMTTTTSGGLTNPTPTPSELSGGSGKKKSKLKPKALFKKFKPGKKKNETQ